jgi:hypothetical protein
MQERDTFQHRECLNAISEVDCRAEAEELLPPLLLTGPCPVSYPVCVFRDVDVQLSHQRSRWSRFYLVSHFLSFLRATSRPSSLHSSPDSDDTLTPHPMTSWLSQMLRMPRWGILSRKLKNLACKHQAAFPHRRLCVERNALGVSPRVGEFFK